VQRLRGLPGASARGCYAQVERAFVARRRREDQMLGGRTGWILLVLASAWLASTACGRDTNSATGSSEGTTGGTSYGVHVTPVPRCTPGETQVCEGYFVEGVNCTPVQRTCLADGTWGGCEAECAPIVCQSGLTRDCVGEDGCPGEEVCGAFGSIWFPCECTCQTCTRARCESEDSACASNSCVDEWNCMVGCVDDLRLNHYPVEPDEVDECVSTCASEPSGLPSPEFSALYACIMRDRYCPSLCYGMAPPQSVGGAGGTSGAAGADGASGRNTAGDATAGAGGAGR
jgi:hypothetical protein